MQELCVQIDFGACGATAEEVHHAAAPQEARGELPQFRLLPRPRHQRRRY
jgi:hypothetical protein